LIPHFLGQTFNLGFRKDLLVHHSGEKLVDRPRPETLDEMPHGVCGHTLGWCGGLVKIRLAFEAVAEIAAGLEAAQERADARILERMFGQERFANLFGGSGSARPEDIQDGLLQLGKGALERVTLCHVTQCNAQMSKNARAILGKLKRAATRGLRPQFVDGAVKILFGKWDVFESSPGWIVFADGGPVDAQGGIDGGFDILGIDVAATGPTGIGGG
jgi:hypothetical protein